MTFDKQGFKNVVKSLSLYHRITSNRFSFDENGRHDDSLIEKLYVDLLPDQGILQEVLEDNTLFLIGRKGTGKSTIFARAQYEIQKSKKKLSVYINAKSIYKKSEISNIASEFEGLKHVFSQDELMKLQLIRNFILELKKSLLDELEKEENGFVEKVRNIIRDQQLSRTLSELEYLVNEPELVNLNKLIVNDNKQINKDELVAQVRAELQNLSLQGNAKYTKSETGETVYQNVIARVFNIGEIVEKLNKIIEICNRNSLLIFIDDYSELSRSDRSVFMESIISPIYHLGVEKIHLKIACYPNKFEPLKLDSGKFKFRYIDIYHIYGRDNTITGTEKKAIEYTKRLLENRIKNYCDPKTKIEDYFDLNNATMKEYYKLLYQSSINIPRVLGHILNDCYLKNIVYDKPITKNSIIEASKQYYLDHVSSYFEKFKFTLDNTSDDKLDIFVQENLINALINHAQKNKYKLKDTPNSYFKDLETVPTSHFTILPQHEQYLESLEFNGFIHKLNIIAGKGREKESFKNQNRLLYCFDRGLCANEKIDYGKPEGKDTKFYQQRAFEYDDILLMTLKDNKRIVCKECGTNYSIDELDEFKKFNMKCKNADCPNGKCEIEFDRELKELAEEKLCQSILSESEFDIIYAIHLLNRNLPDEDATANLISREVDYSSQFIAWRCKKLEESGYIFRAKAKDKDVYVYTLTDRAKNLLEQILNKRGQSTE